MALFGSHLKLLCARLKKVNEVQGQVVRKPVNVNPGLKFNPYSGFLKKNFHD